MASIGILTFLHNQNYGSALQAYALQRTLRELGQDCEHLDYAPDRAEKIRNLITSGNSPRLILDGIRKREVQAGQAGARQKREAIPAFYARHMRLSPPCRNGEELRRESEKYDILLCGSDQIWNPVWLNGVYFLNFAPPEKCRLAYACSLGVSTLPSGGKIRKIQRWTAGFEAISVREEEGASLMERMTGLRPAVMPDPVCLLSREEWVGLAEEAPSGERRLLCYFIGDRPDYWEKVRTLQRETGLRPLVLPVTAGSYASGYEVLDGAAPEAFLGAIRGAAHFCTDSFHGLVFATIFGTPVTLLRRDAENDPESKNSRVDHFRRLVKEKGMDSLRAQGRTWLREQLNA